MSDNPNFEGTWHSVYWYPSNNHSGEDTSEYDVVIKQEGNQLILESLPNSTGSYIFVRLSVDDDVVTGTWHETTAPEGDFKGMIYSGALQLLVSRDENSMEGKWVGVGRDYEKNRQDIFSGRWQLTRRT